MKSPDLKRIRKVKRLKASGLSLSQIGAKFPYEKGKNKGKPRDKTTIFRWLKDYDYLL